MVQTNRQTIRQTIRQTNKQSINQTKVYESKFEREGRWCKTSQYRD